MAAKAVASTLKTSLGPNGEYNECCAYDLTFCDQTVKLAYHLGGLDECVNAEPLCNLSKMKYNYFDFFFHITPKL